MNKVNLPRSDWFQNMLSHPTSYLWLSELSIIFLIINTSDDINEIYIWMESFIRIFQEILSPWDKSLIHYSKHVALCGFKYLMKEHSQSLFSRDLQLRSERSRDYSDFVIPAVIID